MNKNTLILLAISVVSAACGGAEDPNRVVGELASDRHELAAEVSEPIRAIHVAEGELVAAGQVRRELTSRAQRRISTFDKAS